MYEILDENYIHSHGSDVNIFFLSQFFHVKVTENPKVYLLEKYRLSDMKPSKSLTLSYFEQLALFHHTLTQKR